MKRNTRDCYFLIFAYLSEFSCDCDQYDSHKVMNEAILLGWIFRWFLFVFRALQLPDIALSYFANIIEKNKNFFYNSFANKSLVIVSRYMISYKPYKQFGAAFYEFRVCVFPSIRSFNFFSFFFLHFSSVFFFLL